MFESGLLFGIIAGVIVLGVALVLTIIISMAFRVVVSTNDVHIVQTSRKTISYGKDQPAGNTYYKWPAWVPFIGLRTIVLPVSVFDQGLENYAAYDKGRVPFIVDIIAFFRVTDSNVAAQRVHSFPELEDQLQSILKGVIRTILASSEIEEILEGRSKFGEMFTKEVDEQLGQWGVQTVKCIELMDIRDASGSKVIANIMEKKKSLIEMESRIEVARNMKDAELAEVDAKREVSVREQDALQQVGIRTAEKDQVVGIANEKMKQTIQQQATETAKLIMDTRQVENVRAAEIHKQTETIQAEQDKMVRVIKAEGEKTSTVTLASGALEATKLQAEGIQATGEAKAAAEKAIQLAPVEAQIVLAKEIGENESYQTYLIQVRQIEAGQIVGVEQAKALNQAEIKVIANASSPSQGVTNVMDLFTTGGATQLSGAIEAFAQSETGAALIKKVTGTAK